MTWNANNTSRFSIGNRADGQGNEAFNGSVTLFKMGIGAPSAQDIRQIYNDEKKLFGIDLLNIYFQKHYDLKEFH